jgi:hypothetical protein
MERYGRDFGMRRGGGRLPHGGLRGDARHFGGGPYDVGFGPDAPLPGREMRPRQGWDREMRDDGRGGDWRGAPPMRGWEMRDVGPRDREIRGDWSRGREMRGDPSHGREMRGGGGWDPGFGYGGFAAGDRGVYGEAYPGPAAGMGMRGVHYGADEGMGPQPASGYDRELRRASMRGYDVLLRRPGRGYDAGFARAEAPFLPDWFYARHPEYRNAPHHPDDRWRGGRGRAAVLDDDEVQERVRERLAADEWVDEARVFVDVEDGVVTLSGEVDDFMEARYAWDDAWETDGVRGVVNQLTVRTDVPQPDRHGDAFPQD